MIDQRLPGSGYRTQPLRRELRPLYPGRRQLPLVAALAGYFDASWSDPKKPERGIVAIAGYVGTVDMWDEQFSPSWNAMLAAANEAVAADEEVGPDNRIREFKASDCRQLKGEFKKWKREHCNALTHQAVSEIVAPERRIVGLGAAVSIDYTRLSADKKVRRQFELYCFSACLLLVIADALAFATPMLGEDHLQIIFDEERDREYKMVQTFDELRRHVVPDFLDRIRRPHFSHSHEVPPLQAADLLAYETYKEIRNRTDSPPREPSRALRRLVARAAHVGRYMRMSDLAVEWAKWVRREPIADRIPSSLMYFTGAAEMICRDAPVGGVPPLDPSWVRG
jgi:hypothetical protein